MTIYKLNNLENKIYNYLIQDYEFINDFLNNHKKYKNKKLNRYAFDRFEQFAKDNGLVKKSNNTWYTLPKKRENRYNSLDAQKLAIKLNGQKLETDFTGDIGIAFKYYLKVKPSYMMKDGDHVNFIFDFYENLLNEAYQKGMITNYKLRSSLNDYLNRKDGVVIYLHNERVKDFFNLKEQYLRKFGLDNDDKLATDNLGFDLKTNNFDMSYSQFVAYVTRLGEEKDIISDSEIYEKAKMISNKLGILVYFSLSI